MKSLNRSLGVVVLMLTTVLLSVSVEAQKKTIEIRFETKKISVAGKTLTVELADTNEKASRGLMYRTKLAEGSGMLFIFPDEDYRTFWMKNTFIPLSIGYFDGQKKLVEIIDMEATKSEMDQQPKTYPSHFIAKYALEVPQGWFQKHKVAVGSRLSGL